LQSQSSAHTFGVNYKDKNIADYGDITTKLFHTIEGGALMMMNLYKKLGIKNQEEIPHLGTNE
jgi:dTDP-4-amino-4,6-dideoxygalactose transaminase